MKSSRSSRREKSGKPSRVSLLSFKVQDGDVTLEGVATDWAEADAAVGTAFEGGARSVRARLDLADGSEYTRYYAHDYEYYRYEHFYETL